MDVVVDYFAGSEKMSVKQVAATLGVCCRTVRNYAHAGKIPFAKINQRVWIFDDEVVQKFKSDSNRLRDMRVSMPPRRKVDIDILNVIASPEIQAFNRRYGRGIVEAWSLCVAYAGVRSGKVDIPRGFISEALGLDMGYVEKCISTWKKWRWVGESEINRTRIMINLTNVDGSVPEALADVVTPEQNAKLGNDGLYEIKGEQVVLIEDDVDHPFDTPADPDPVDCAEYKLLSTMTQKEAQTIKKPAKSLPKEVQLVVTHWVETAAAWGIKKREPKIDGDIERKIRRALSEYGIDRVFDAIEGCFMRDYNRENGHIGLALILRDNAHIEDYESLKENAATLTGVSSSKPQDKVSVPVVVDDEAAKWAGVPIKTVEEMKVEMVAKMRAAGKSERDIDNNLFMADHGFDNVFRTWGLMR